MTFVHELGEANGYAYVYRKTLRLEGDTMVLDHSLRNTGRKRIETSVYNHNFFTLDRRPTGPQVSVTFPFDAKADARRSGRWPRSWDATCGLRANSPRVRPCSRSSKGFGTGRADYDFLMTARGDRRRRAHPRAIGRSRSWSSGPQPRTVCPEPYVDASVDPGQTTTWRITYEFSEIK